MLTIGGRDGTLRTAAMRSLEPFDPSEYGSSAAARSATFSKRREGSFSRHLSTTALSPSEISGRIDFGGSAGSWTTLRHSSGMASASNGTRPVSSS
jgi:hypothetical protein